LKATLPIAVCINPVDPATCVVTLSGEQDAYSAPRLENELYALLDEAMAVVVGLTEATFLDSQSLSLLLSARHRAERGTLGFGVVLPRKPYTQVHRILEITGLIRTFAVYPNSAAALAATRAGENAGHARGRINAVRPAPYRPVRWTSNRPVAASRNSWARSR
jgi:anti-anti-sigma factor